MISMYYPTSLRTIISQVILLQNQSLTEGNPHAIKNVHSSLIIVTIYGLVYGIYSLEIFWRFWGQQVL